VTKLGLFFQHVLSRVSLSDVNWNVRIIPK
jgi:hypothetical protein